MKKIYDFKKQFTSDDYRMLITTLADYIPYFSLVVRETIELSSDGKEILNALKPYLIFEKNVSEWPGTKLHYQNARLHVFKLNKKTASILLKNTKNIFDWKQPDRPEDFSLLRNDKTALFVSISHEKDFYFELTDEELIDLKKLLPKIKLNLHKDKE